MSIRKWLAGLKKDPPAPRYESFNDRWFCLCWEARDKPEFKVELSVHFDRQDTTSDAWKRLLDLIETAAADGRERLAPAEDLGLDHWRQIVTLPKSIAKLKSVKVLQLGPSALSEIPPEIGQMTALEDFDPYMSYRLHWFPYEITRCKNLKHSRVSTRALYGNFKFRVPFPRLPQQIDRLAPDCCSVCSGPFDDSGPHQCWVSLWVATDVLPLLVHACADECIDRLPPPAEGYVRAPHKGGLQLKQPPTSFWGPSRPAPSSPDMQQS